MANIQVLDQSTINQIAAGEVIERPASVVKELMENAIDAKATAVTVEIKDGGISFIRVTDNGWGIPKEEIPTAFLRHSTSKIKSVEDLITVSSLGFRGEALSSIAAISQVELITKTSNSLTGARYQIDGGEEKGLEEIGAPEGTTFIARNLFYNTPARRKFLKTPMTEGAHVAELVEKIALSHPEISIRLIQNNQNKLHTSGNHNLKDMIYTVFGREIAANLLSVEAGNDTVRITGFVGKPVIARGNRNYENYYINGRYIKSRLISKAIEEAYKPFMMQHKYPFVLLHFAIDPAFLDVNVHPTKMELRFRDGEMIYRIIYDSVTRTLSHKELIPEVDLEERKAEKPEAFRPEMKGKPEPFERQRMQSILKEEGVYQTKADRDTVVSPDLDAFFDGLMAGRPEKKQVVKLPGTLTQGEQLRERSGNRSSTEQVQPGRQLLPQPSCQEGEAEKKLNPRLILEQTLEQKEEVNRQGEAESLTIHQSPMEHAEEVERKPGGGNQAKQLDLFEEKLLTPKARMKHQLIGQLFDTYWLVEYQDNLYIIDQHAAHEKVLYEKTIRSLKDREYTSQMINPPIILTLSTNEEILLNRYMDHFTAIGFEIEHFGGREYAVRGVPGNLFSIAKKDLLMEMIDGLSDDLSRDNPDIIYEKIASMSCKAAVKGNHRLSPLEANQLIDQLLDLENPYACPHGRPTIISMSKYELEKKFKRIV